MTDWRRWRVEALRRSVVHELGFHRPRESQQATCKPLRMMHHSQDEIIDARDRDLDAQGILAGAEEVLDFDVLLKPVEEQLDLPARLVEVGDVLRRIDEVVVEKSRVRPVSMTMATSRKVMPSSGCGPRTDLRCSSMAMIQSGVLLLPTATPRTLMTRAGVTKKLAQICSPESKSTCSFPSPRCFSWPDQARDRLLRRILVVSTRWMATRGARRRPGVACSANRSANSCAGRFALAPASVERAGRVAPR